MHATYITSSIARGVLYCPFFGQLGRAQEMGVYIYTYVSILEPLHVRLNLAQGSSFVAVLDVVVWHLPCDLILLFTCFGGIFPNNRPPFTAPSQVQPLTTKWCP
jgi:hypothetical protein